MKPFWTTFYSYKGGVGRSLAMANVGALLVQEGRRVVLIDFDLEAPGIDSFSEFQSTRGKPGVVEYVSTFHRHQVAPDITEYVHKCELDNHLRGKLWIMPAGKKDRAYSHQLGHIPWAELYETGYGEAFFENWKAAIESEYNPDYVFVDSRTGLTEIGGVCTTQFADLVVMLFSLNQQNIEGTARVATSIRESELENPPQLMFVATPVPDVPGEAPTQKRFLSRSRRAVNELTERFDVANKLLGQDVDISISYYAPASLKEKLFVLHRSFSERHAIVRDYMFLRRKITVANRSGLDFLLEQASDAIEQNDLVRKKRLKAVFEREFSDRAEALHSLARFRATEGDTDGALKLEQQAFKMDPLYVGSCDFLLNHFERNKEVEKKVELLNELLAKQEFLDEDRLKGIHLERGHSYMQLEDYEKAADSYEYCYRRVKDEEKTVSEAGILAYAFNAAEAKRRASKRVERSDWEEVVKYFGAKMTTRGVALPEQANRWQAMHIAFACTGDLMAAREALEKAQRVAKNVGEIDDVFCVKYYRDVRVKDFIIANEEMLKALEKGKLWDGMKLENR